MSFILHKIIIFSDISLYDDRYCVTLRPFNSCFYDHEVMKISFAKKFKSNSQQNIKYMSDMFANLLMKIVPS